MAGSQAVRGKGPFTRGGRSTSGGKSSGGRGNGKSGQSSQPKSIGDLAPLQIRSVDRTTRQVNPGTDTRGKGKAVDVGGSRSQPNGDDGTPKGPRSNRRSVSSHDSNPLGERQLSPPSHETPQSANASASRTNLVPLQYPASSNRLVPSNLNLNGPPQRLHVQDELEEEEDEEDEEEADEDLEPLPNDAENEDYQQLLDQILANPGRQSLPILSEHPVPNRDDSYWLVLSLSYFFANWFTDSLL